MTRVGYLGPPGTFSEEALRGDPQLPDGAELVPLPTIHGVVVAVAEGDVDRALAPIENMLEGSVNEVVDALLHDAPGVRIAGECVLPVRYGLLARPGARIQDIRVVLSHPQALAQCARWLRENLPTAELRSRSSTAEAVREVASGEDQACAALGSAVAAELYGAVALAERIGDDPPNVTRFVWLAREQSQDGRGSAGGGSIGDPQSDRRAAGGPWKSSIAFFGDGDGSAGWLVRCLSEFAFRGVNLTRIESRPARRRLGHYVFLVDLDGRADEPGPVAEAIAALRPHCEEVRVLGCYPRATGA